ncbi:MAG: FxsA family protein [Hyphomicrobiales bacterium]
MILFFIFIAVPLIEIALFIQIGSLIGLWPTLATVVATAVIGTWLLRHQGFAVISQAQESAARNELPVQPIIHGVFLLAAGLLMLTPGFFTDVIGFALLIPPVRLAIAHSIWSRIKDNVHVVTPGMGPSHQAPSGSDRHPDKGPIIDGEVVSEDTDNDRPNEQGSIDSPWRER